MFVWFLAARNVLIFVPFVVVVVFLLHLWIFLSFNIVFICFFDIVVVLDATTGASVSHDDDDDGGTLRYNGVHKQPTELGATIG